MRYGKVDKEFAMRLATMPPDEDGPVLMVNFMRYHEVARYEDAAGSATGDSVSGREADDRYAPVDVLAQIGAVVAYHGDVVTDAGEPSEWHRVGIVQYPTRRSFIEMQSRRDFQDKHVHKEAGMEFTIVLACTPTGPFATERAERARFLRFVAWPAGTGPVDAPHDAALLDVEGRIIGDDRTWSHLTVHLDDAPDAPTGDLPEGAMVVRTRSSLDRMMRLIDGWPTR